MQFSSTWFDGHIDAWTQVLKEMRGKPIRYLEIGTYEGRSLCWLLENILTHEVSHATVIDPFTGSVEHIQEGINFSTIKERFFHNIEEWKSKVTVHVGTSKECLPNLFKGTEKFDLIYIDGSHMAGDVLFDATLSWELLKDDGIMIFDDYMWDLYKDHRMTPKVAIDAFLSVNAGSYTLIEKDWDVIIRKHVEKDIITEPDPDSYCYGAISAA